MWNSRAKSRLAVPLLTAWVLAGALALPTPAAAAPAADE
jgi:hypothetical protein